MDENRKNIILLTTIPGIGAVKANKLIKSFKCVKDIFSADKRVFYELGFLTSQNIESILDKKYQRDLDRVLENIYKTETKVVTILEESYPYYLKNIYDPPIALFYKGELLKDEKCLSIIGSRKATAYGLKMTEIIADSLSRVGFTIVSGMARGIDSNAHLAALKAGGRTVAVLGCGVDIVYPPENRGLRDKIIQSGAVISEFLPGTNPLAYNFPQRNRIISGLALGVVVIEAGEKSGSLITANIALEEGREVFALPGSVISENSRGTNKLIKDGAKIVLGIEDILEELNGFHFEKKEYQNIKLNKKVFNSLDDDEKLVYKEISKGEVHIDELVNSTGLEIKTLNSILIIMELKGIVEKLPGQKYIVFNY